MKDAFCTAFGKVNEYRYCLTVHNTVPYSCLFGVYFVKFRVGWKFCLWFCILMLHILSMQYSSCYVSSFFKLIHLSVLIGEPELSARQS